MINLSNHFLHLIYLKIKKYYAYLTFNLYIKYLQVFDYFKFVLYELWNVYKWFNSKVFILYFQLELLKIRLRS